MSTTNILDLNNRIDELEKNSGGGGSADSAKRSDIATEFSTETSYTAGNFVYYEGKLYQFNADHSAGAWDPTDVVESNVTDQIVSNASAIAGLTASDVAYDNTSSGLTATHVQGAIDEVAGAMGNVKMTKLWENPNPSVDFAEQSLPLDLLGYNLIMAISANNIISVASNAVGQTLYLAEPVSGAGGTSIRRRLGAITSTGITWEAGYQSTSWQVGTISNSLVKPYLIYGIKLT